MVSLYKKGEKMKHTLITVSGQLGSGKSTVVNLLAQKLGWQTYSTGQAQRQIAEKMDISTIELNRLALTDKTIDEQVDGVFKNPPWGTQPCVVDSRLAFHFLPRSFKVYLSVNPKEAARRVFMANRSNEKYTSQEEALIYLAKRRQLEQAHFTKNYQLDIENDKLFDLVIDTTDLTPEQVCDKIIQKL
jgi:cytidylate kinase